MFLRFAFLLITRVTSWLRLSRGKEAWKTGEILILRHQLAVLQRRQPRRPHLTWADRALLATLLSVMPKARRHGLRLLVAPTRSCAGTATPAIATHGTQHTPQALAAWAFAAAVQTDGRGEPSAAFPA